MVGRIAFKLGLCSYDFEVSNAAKALEMITLVLVVFLEMTTLSLVVFLEMTTLYLVVFDFLLRHW